MATKLNFLYAGANFGLRTFNNLVIFGILARLVGLVNFGLINYLITVISLISALAIFGFRMQIVREVAVNKDIVNLDYILKKIIVVVLFFLICMVVSLYYLLTRDLNINNVAVILFCSSALFFSVSGVLFSFFHAINKFYLETYALVAFTIVQVLGLVATWQSGHMRWYALSYGIGAMAMMFVALYFFIQNYKTQLNRSWGQISTKSINREIMLAMPFAIITTGDILLSTADVLIVQEYVSMEDLGIYTGVMKMVLGIGLLSAVAYSALLPTISRLLHKANEKSFSQLFKLQAAIMLIGGIGCMTFYSFDDFFIDLFLGSSFSECSFYAVNMFSKEISLFALSRYWIVIPAIILITSGSQTKRALALVIVFLLSFMAYFLLVPQYGIPVAIRLSTGINILLCFIYMILSYSEYRRVTLIHN